MYITNSLFDREATQEFLEVRKLLLLNYKVTLERDEK